MKLILSIIMVMVTGFIYGQSMGLALEGEEWKDVRSFPVKGRQGILINQKLSFGDFRTLDVDRSWIKGTQVTTGITQGIPTDEYYTKIITTDKIHKKQTIYFALTDSLGNQSKAFIAGELDVKDFNIGNSPVSAINLLLDLVGPGVESSDFTFTKLYIGESADGWELVIDNQAAQAQPKKYIGYLAKSNEEFYTVIPLSRVKSKKGKVANMPFGSAGFEIRNKSGEALAAVSIIDNGIIYLKDIDPHERLLMATACASLLLRPEDLE